MREVSDRTRQRELRELAEIYLPTRLCLGRHLVHSQYVCPWCHSTNPDTICHKEKVRTKHEKPNDYTNQKDREAILKYELV